MKNCHNQITAKPTRKSSIPCARRTSSKRTWNSTNNNTQRKWTTGTNTCTRFSHPLKGWKKKHQNDHLLGRTNNKRNSRLSFARSSGASSSSWSSRMKAKKKKKKKNEGNFNLKLRRMPVLTRADNVKFKTKPRWTEMNGFSGISHTYTARVGSWGYTNTFVYGRGFYDSRWGETVVHASKLSFGQSKV